MSVQCWPNGSDTRFGRDCDQELPDDSSETISRFGWGWGLAVDHGAASGEGFFLMCPEHRGDCSEEEREAARALNKAAKEPAR